MTQKPKTTAEVVPLFSFGFDQREVTDSPTVGRVVEAVSHPAEPIETAIDLSGQIKAWLVAGAGNTGKTTFSRWLADQIFENGGDAVLAAIDPENRELADYFRGVQVPPTYDPEKVSKWLEFLLTHLVERKQTAQPTGALVDCGGGDTALGRLASEHPGLVGMMAGEGISLVAAYTLSPRIADLSALSTLEASGFQPAATVLILNEGRGDPSLPRERSFAEVRRHPVYRAARDRGAVEIWMPRLHCAAPIENQRLSFKQAREGVMPEGRKTIPLNIFDRSRLHVWLSLMNAAFAPIRSWIP